MFSPYRHYCPSSKSKVNMNTKQSLTTLAKKILRNESRIYPSTTKMKPGVTLMSQHTYIQSSTDLVTTKLKNVNSLYTCGTVWPLTSQCKIKSPTPGGKCRLMPHPSPYWGGWGFTMIGALHYPLPSTW